MSESPIAYPAARSSGTRERFHGIEIADPFDWLEDTQHREVQAWLAAQRQLTEQRLSSLHARARVLESLDADAPATPERVPQRRGHARYSFGRSSNGGATLIRTRASEVQIVDPAEVAEIRALRLHAAATYLSPRGRLAALGLSQAGSDWIALRIFDLERGELLAPCWPETAHLVVEWLPDESGFFYNRTRARMGAHEACDGVYRHRLGDPSSEDELVFDHQGEGHAALPLLIRGGRGLLIKTLDFVTQRAALFYRDLNDSKPARCVLPYAAPCNVIGEHAREILIESKLQASRGRILAADPDDAAPHWREVIPEQDAALAVAAHATWSPLAALVGPHLAATYIVDAAHRVRILDLRDGSIREAPVPGLFTVLELRADGDEVRVAITGFTVPYACYVLSPSSNSLTLEASVRSPRLPADAEVEQIFCVSDDGTRVPAFVVRAGRSRTAPTLLYGYGGWGSSLTPWFRADLVAWLALGGNFGVANVRGGGEYGEEWHAAGARLNRHKSFEDFCAVAADLIERRICPVHGLAIRGISNGGLLVAAAVQRRPELFAAAAAQIPLVDVVHLNRLPAGKAIAAELGDPEADRATFEYLLAYSPLQNVRPSGHRPAMIVAPAERDKRVSPCQSYKFVAALQASSAPGQVALLRTIDGEGHGGWPWTVERELIADELAFLWRHAASQLDGVSR